jgi:hypothetical protein
MRGKAERLAFLGVHRRRAQRHSGGGGGASDDVSSTYAVHLEFFFTPTQICSAAYSAGFSSRQKWPAPAMRSTWALGSRSWRNSALDPGTTYSSAPATKSVLVGGRDKQY